MTSITFEEGDIIELCFERYGNIRPYIVEKIGHRGQGEFSFNNSFYLVVRKLVEEDLGNVILKDEKGNDVSYKLKELK